MLKYSNILLNVCYEHSNFLKVNEKIDLLILLNKQFFYKKGLKEINKLSSTIPYLIPLYIRLRTF